jgi:hypothetical protein
VAEGSPLSACLKWREVVQIRATGVAAGLSCPAMRGYGRDCFAHYSRLIKKCDGQFSATFGVYD